jgi:site-specific DNA recombinase
VTLENLRIVSDAIWFAAQARLAKNRGIRGRRPNNENADPSLRVLSGLFWCPEHDRPLRACSAYGKYLGCPSCAMLEADQRPLFSKPNRIVVRRLLCEKLAELIRHDAELVAKIIAECQAQAAAIQRPDGSEIERLEKMVANLTRKIDFNMRNPGESDQDEKEIVDTLRNLRRERQGIQEQLALIKAAATEPVRVPTESEVTSLLDNFSDVLRRAAAGELGDDQDTARDILETLTSGRIDKYQQGDRKEMRGWLQGRFMVRLLDVLVEKIAGPRPAKDGNGVEVVIDFKRPRKTDADADAAIRLWLDRHMSKKIATQLGLGETYVSRLLRIGASRMGMTLEALKSQRKTRPVDPRRAPRYQLIADDVKALWWDALYPLAEVARKLRCSTTTVNAAIAFWFESRGLPVPTFEDWSARVEERVVMLFDANILTIQEIGNAVHFGRTRVMVIVRDVYRRLGKELPDGRTRRSQLKGDQSSVRPAST